MATRSGTAPRTMRADARRNYQRLLTEAKAAFLAQGSDAPLEEIARRAGVGIGTLYRHFPDRTALMAAVFTGEVDALVSLAGELAGRPDPVDALAVWLRAVITHSTAYRGLGKALMATGAAGLDSCQAPLRQAGGTLLERARDVGGVRPDADIPDLLRLCHAIGLAAEADPDDPGLADRLLALAVDGLRARETS
ncbi:MULTISPECIES: TetR/AcrR family transcriptional regulator [Streptomycetaceae]|uniref:TetR-family transcriptional regulator n=1 Tax=Streptantibioticus cattleyicolor (strain ATCC 35852 / DSM 46488 / JCM 4925 / NBRC 14057 / NRRL 8057) TaxID=1003195 RepID=F8K3Z9_STREN|nr:MULTISPECIES: TetR/AcrR family transcriptional regulator [Streptomycetaceae]AEW96174.1 tetR-family transcriptional regulator [Streptantibioticus cattleyicolor NRRL 8057 = DSM 46488]MYS60698.1 TetR family transcriptional regulator [Streptomyces sp. SID5468]CCB76510.1 TetR-family transcriptional regulator [Streptantibioticus cattleyicolor NRRL 8057 = DSM 46488]